MPLTYWPAFAPWRVLYSSGEQRWWRCRPTAAGVELGFRTDDETEWSTRIAHKPRLPSTGEIVPDRRNAQAESTRRAIALVAEQRAEGMEERSPPVAEQLWDELVQRWRDEDPAFDVDRLVAAQTTVSQPPLADVKTWLAECAVSEVPHDLVWWPPIPAARKDAATAALAEHAATIVPALLLALRHVYSGHAAIRAALLAAAPLADDALVFDALLSRTLHTPPWLLQDAVAFTNLIENLCSATRERAALLVPIIRDAPPRHSANVSRYKASIIGFELGLVLTAWRKRYGASL